MQTTMSIATTKPWAIIYIRVSSDEQVDGTSLDFQEQECRGYCERMGFEVIQVFREEGESAKDLSLNNRKVFLQAIECCRKNKGKVQAFVVLRLNRFSRCTEDHYAVRAKLLTYGTNLHSVTERIGNKPQEKVFEGISVLFAEYENAIRKQQCSDGMSAKIDEGIYPWKSPLGYICGNFKKRGLKKTEPDKPDEKRLGIIGNLFRTCLEQKIRSSVELSRLANQLGLTTKNGGKIYPQKIDEIFANKFYAGIIVNPFTGKEIEGKHKRIINPEEFNQIQLIRKGKITTLVVKRRKNNPVFPLTRDIKCATCGIGLSGSKNRGDGGVYNNYHCHNRKKDEAGLVIWKCKMYGKSINREKLHQNFIAWLKTITPKQEFMDLFKAVVVDVWRNNASLLEDTIKRQDSEIQELKQRKVDYVEMIRKGTISEDFGKEMIERVDNEIAVKQLTMRENTIDKLDIETAVTYATNFITDLPRTWLDLEIETKKQFQKLILPEGITYSKESGFGTAKLGLIYELNRQFDGEKTDLVDLGRIELPSPHCKCGVLNRCTIGPFSTDNSYQ
jgi:site-specific DNA recombinase